MSLPRATGSTGMSSVSGRQDLAKLRECLGSTELDGSDDDSISSTSTPIPESLQYIASKITSDRIQSTATTMLSAAGSSNFTGVTSLTMKQNPENYIKDRGLEAALVTNEMYQEALEDAIARLQIALLNNKERQSCAQRDLEQTARESGHKLPSNSLKARRWHVLTPPYIKDRDGYSCSANPDAIKKRRNHEISPYIVRPRKWKKLEKEILLRAVKKNINKNIMEPLFQRRALLNSRLKEPDLSLEQIAEFERKFEEVNLELSTKGKLSDSELEKLNNRDLDWMQMSVVELDGNRTPESCELYWLKALHPSIYKGQWTEEEDNQLTYVVKRHGNRDWDAIAKDLGSSRTAEQCIKRFNGHLNTEIVQKGPWTVEENKILENAIDVCRVGNKIQWGKVSTFLEKRHPSLIRQHWRISLNKEIKKGSWTEAEDIMLLVGVKKYGTVFSKIEPFLPGRTYMQIRERYLNSLNLQINYGKWTPDEDRELIRLAKSIGTKWADLSEVFQNRTPNMIMQRHSRILKNIPDAYEIVENHEIDWPVTPSHTNFNAINRRRKIYDHFERRAKALTNAPLEKMRVRHTAKRPRNAPPPLKEMEEPEDLIKIQEGFRTDLKNPTHVAFMFEEAKCILNRSPSKKAGRSKSKSERMASIDQALDDMLLPTITCLETGRKKSVALTSKQTLEFGYAKEVLFKILKIPLQNSDHTENSDNYSSTGEAQLETICGNRDSLSLQKDIHASQVSKTNNFSEFQSTGEVQLETICGNGDSLSLQKDIHASQVSKTNNFSEDDTFRNLDSPRHPDNTPTENLNCEIKFDIVSDHSLQEHRTETPKLNDVQSSEQNVSSSSGQEVESPVKKNKLTFRSEIYAHSISETLTRHCLGNTNFLGDNPEMRILPPMRPTVEAFKFMAMDRPRLAELAGNIQDINLLQEISSAPPNASVKCSKCKLSVRVKTERIEDESYETEDVTVLPKPCDDCEELEKLHSKYMTFRDRFLSIFFWPGLMCTVPPPKDSIDPSDGILIRPKVPAGRGRKRKYRGMSRKVPEPREISKKPRVKRIKNLEPTRISSRVKKEVT